MVRDVMVQLLQRQLLIACDRKFKRPKPGRTKLVKWPRTLEAMRVGFLGRMPQEHIPRPPSLPLLPASPT